MEKKHIVSRAGGKGISHGVETVIKNQSYIYKSPSLVLNIPITSRVAVITGDSGTGKTFFAEDIKEAKELGKQSEVKTNCELSNTLVLLEKDDYDKFDYNTHKKLIILDKADPYVNDKMIEFIRCSNNLFIIMSRGHNEYLGKLKTRLDDVIELKGQRKNGVVTITGVSAI